MRKTQVIVFCVSLLTVLGSGDAYSFLKNRDDARILKVGLVDDYLPCSDSGKSGAKSGFAIDIWREIQEELIDISYEPINIKSFNKAVEYASEGKADLIVSCHTITKERLEKVEFSVPYVRNSVGMISAIDNRSYFNRVISLFGQDQVFKSLVLLIGITGIVAASITFLERSKYDIKKREKIQQILKTWALLFIGQALESLADRRMIYVPLILVAGCAQILLVTVLVAELTTANLQATKYEAIEDIKKSKFRKIIFEGLAVVEGTETQSRLLNKMKADGLVSNRLLSKLVFPEKLPQMIQGLQSGKYKHMLASSSVLEYILSHDLDPLKFEMSVVSKYSTPEAFVFGKNLSIEDRKTINQAIAEMNYNGRIIEILGRYK
jgi:ABC-type amino acid transport substrate-binding protein